MEVDDLEGEPHGSSTVSKGEKKRFEVKKVCFGYLYAIWKIS